MNLAQSKIKTYTNNPFGESPIINVSCVVQVSQSVDFYVVVCTLYIVVCILLFVYCCLSLIFFVMELLVCYRQKCLIDIFRVSFARCFFCCLWDIFVWTAPKTSLAKWVLNSNVAVHRLVFICAEFYTRISVNRLFLNHFEKRSEWLNFCIYYFLMIEWYNFP